MYRRRLALEWRATVAVGVTAVAGVVLAQFPRPVDDAWPLSMFAAILLVAVIALVVAVRSPVEPPPAVPKRFGHDDVTAATTRARRGQPVDPPDLQAAAIGAVRRDLRIGLLAVGWWPVIGGTWALRIGEDGFFGGFGYVGLVVMVLGAGGLAWSGVTQRRVDRLESRSVTDHTLGP